MTNVVAADLVSPGAAQTGKTDSAAGEGAAAEFVALFESLVDVESPDGDEGLPKRPEEDGIREALDTTNENITVFAQTSMATVPQSPSPIFFQFTLPTQYQPETVAEEAALGVELSPTVRQSQSSALPEVAAGSEDGLIALNRVPAQMVKAEGFQQELAQLPIEIDDADASQAVAIGRLAGEVTKKDEGKPSAASAFALNTDIELEPANDLLSKKTIAGKVPGADEPVNSEHSAVIESEVPDALSQAAPVPSPEFFRMPESASGQRMQAEPRQRPDIGKSSESPARSATAMLQPTIAFDLNRVSAGPSRATETPAAFEGEIWPAVTEGAQPVPESAALGEAVTAPVENTAEAIKLPQAPRQDSPTKASVPGESQPQVRAIGYGSEMAETGTGNERSSQDQNPQQPLFVSSESGTRTSSNAASAKEVTHTPLVAPELPAPATSNRPLQNLHLRHEQVDIKLTERGGAIHVAVSTADSELTSQLQRSLPELVNQLERSGMESQMRTSEPASSAKREFAQDGGQEAGQHRWAGGANGDAAGGRSKGRQHQELWQDVIEDGAGPGDTKFDWRDER